jgi:broad specificity phosphatase PhoE
MTQVAILRHGPTAWNADRRLQGRADPPLTDETRRRLAGLRPPAEFADAAWHASPLARARDTAALLGAVELRLEPRLIEMDFGAFEGRRLAELRRNLGSEMSANEARGLDFLPPGGESPRQVRERLQPWLAACAASDGKHLAVSHKGVIRALLSLATGWDMRAKPPHRLDWSALHVFALDADGRPRPERMNLPLERR